MENWRQNYLEMESAKDNSMQLNIAQLDPMCVESMLKMNHHRARETIHPSTMSDFTAALLPQCFGK